MDAKQENNEIIKQEVLKIIENKTTTYTKIKVKQVSRYHLCDISCKYNDNNDKVIVINDNTIDNSIDKGLDLKNKYSENCFICNGPWKYISRDGRGEGWNLYFQCPVCKIDFDEEGLYFAD